ncbi:MAG: ABC transporter ATP-binding protein [Actinomycetales bacterium]|nr:ABC transporter ATP-binding protein [Actinomycetales bacterium]
MQNLSKRFTHDGPVIIDNLNLAIKPGEFVALVGASGCGKSTLLNILSGLDTQTSGTVDLGAAPALLFQEHALLPWLTAGKNIELALKLIKFPKAQRKARAQELLELVHLPHAYNLRPHELSGGMRQRVAIARALAQGRKILLMDEPFAALDAITRDLLHEELIRIWEETGLTVLFVTHNVREAVRLGQRVILMSSRPGRIINEWQIAGDEPRRIESPLVGEMSVLITEELRKEIKRHG